MLHRLGYEWWLRVHVSALDSSDLHFNDMGTRRVIYELFKT